MGNMAQTIALLLFIGGALNIIFGSIMVFFPRWSWSYSQRIRRFFGFKALKMPEDVEKVQGNRGLLGVLAGIMSFITAFTTLANLSK